MWHCIVVEIVIVTILKDRTFLELSLPYLTSPYFIFTFRQIRKITSLNSTKRVDCWSYWRIKRKINFWVGSYFQIMKRKLSIHVETPLVPADQEFGRSACIEPIHWIKYTKPSQTLWSVYQGLTRTHLQRFVTARPAYKSCSSIFCKK